MTDAATTTTISAVVAKNKTASPAATPGYTEAIVREYFADIPVMIQIARCESTFQHTLADGSILRGRVDSADTGVMQVNKRYHLSAATAMGLNLDDIYGNMAYARHLYEKQGTQPWNASAPCWAKTLAANI
jgi:hypothetical protein